MSLIPWENNLVAMRYLLAALVVVNHCAHLTGSGLEMPISSLTAVGGFFALSGFLIYPSYQRNPSLKRFWSRRFQRLLPAYLFIVLLAAVSLWMVSTVDIGDYFGSWHFWKYLVANAVSLNFLEPTLPGVFTTATNLVPAVDGALWTMKVQWLCYATIPVFYFLFTHTRLSKRWLLVAVIVLSMLYRAVFMELYGATGRELYLILSRQLGGMMCYFCTGLLVYLCFAQFKRYALEILATSLVLLCLSPYLPGYYYFLEPVVNSVLIIWLSVIGSWGHAIGRKWQDLSYEIYLFHWPVIQTLVCLGIASAIAPVPFILLSGGLTIILCLIARFILKTYVTSRWTK